ERGGDGDLPAVGCPDEHALADAAAAHAALRHAVVVGAVDDAVGEGRDAEVGGGERVGPRVVALLGHRGVAVLEAGRPGANQAGRPEVVLEVAGTVACVDRGDVG